MTDRELLDGLADHRPDDVKVWLQQHPANLMRYDGLDVKPFCRAALDDALNYTQTFWLAPRGSGKSTAYVYLAAWLSFADPEVYTRAGVPYQFEGAPREIGPHNIRMALTSNSAQKAAASHYQAKAILTGPRMSKLFGNMEGKRWTDAMSETSLRTENLREGTFTALGLGSKVTGGHYDWELADDWVTEDNARTELQRQRLVDFWNFTVKGTHEPWAKTIGAGTRYHPLDWYDHVKQWTEKGLWQHMRRTPALVGEAGDERSYWPELFSVEKLHTIREEIGQVAFAAQYQNEVDAMLGEFFESPWVELHAKWSDLSPEERGGAITVLTLDPAIKAGPRNDFSAFVVLSYVNRKFYVRRVVRGQWTNDGIKRRAHQLCVLYKPDRLGVEVVGGTEWILNDLRKMELPGVKVVPLRPQQFRGKDKVGRASYVRSPFENGRVFFEVPTKENGIARLIYEMLAFPSASNVPGMDDCVDALVWAMILVARGRSRLHRLPRGRGRRR
jgi:phage terminase large subunit-like protein